MNRLSRRTLGDVAPEVALPPAAALEAEVGIVHLGLGAFHRAHQAILTQRALAVAPGALGDQRGQPAQRRRARRAPAAGLPLHRDRERRGRGAGERGRGRPRGTVGARGGASLARPARGPGDADRDADRHREGLLPQSGDRRSRPRPSRHPAPISRAQDPPRSTLGWLVRGLDERRAAGAGGLTVLCCDNMASNGRTLRRSRPAVRRGAGPRASPPGSRTRSASRAAWSTGSCRPPRRPRSTTRPRSWACATRRR